MTHATPADIYQKFYPHWGRLDFCGLGWGIIDQLLNTMPSTEWPAWYGACEQLAEQRKGKNPAEAMALYHFAQFKDVHDVVRKRRLQAHVRKLFIQVMADAPLTVSPLAIEHGDGVLPGYLMESPHQEQWSPTTMILMNGLDSLKEIELWQFARHFLEHGMPRCVIFDGPGQGEVRSEQNRPLAPFDTVVPAVIRSVEAQVDRPIRPILFGVSFGGYLAYRAAQHIKALDATICFSCCEGWGHVPTLPAEVAQLFHYATGEHDPAQFADYVQQRLSLTPEVPPQCPTLIAHGVRDPIMPIEDSRSLRRRHPQTVTLFEYDDGHVFLHQLRDAIADAVAWMTRQELIR